MAPVKNTTMSSQAKNTRAGSKKNDTNEDAGASTNTNSNDMVGGSTDGAGASAEATTNKKTTTKATKAKNALTADAGIGKKTTTTKKPVTTTKPATKLAKKATKLTETDSTLEHAGEGSGFAQTADATTTEQRAGIQHGADTFMAAVDFDVASDNDDGNAGNAGNARLNSAANVPSDNDGGSTDNAGPLTAAERGFPQDTLNYYIDDNNPSSADRAPAPEPEVTKTKPKPKPRVKKPSQQAVAAPARPTTTRPTRGRQASTTTTVDDNAAPVVTAAIANAAVVDNTAPARPTTTRATSGRLASATAIADGNAAPVDTAGIANAAVANNSAPPAKAQKTQPAREAKRKASTVITSSDPPKTKTSKRKAADADTEDATEPAAPAPKRSKRIASTSEASAPAASAAPVAKPKPASRRKAVDTDRDNAPEPAAPTLKRKAVDIEPDDASDTTDPPPKRSKRTAALDAPPPKPTAATKKPTREQIIAKSVSKATAPAKPAASVKATTKSQATSSKQASATTTKPAASSKPAAKSTARKPAAKQAALSTPARPATAAAAGAPGTITTSNGKVQKAPEYAVRKDFRGTPSGNGSSIESPGGQGVLANPWRCGNPGCDTGMTWFDCEATPNSTLSPMGRKFISDYFGRNKHSTRLIPSEVWHWLCRKCYQRQKYQADHVPEDNIENNFASFVHKNIRFQVMRLQLWRPEARFKIQLMKVAADQLHIFQDLLRRPGFDVARAKAAMPAPKKGQTAYEPELLEYAYQNSVTDDFVYYYDDIHDILDWSEGKVASGESKSAVPIEILIDDLKPGEQVNDIASDANYFNWKAIIQANSEAHAADPNAAGPATTFFRLPSKFLPMPAGRAHDAASDDEDNEDAGMQQADDDDDAEQPATTQQATASANDDTYSDDETIPDPDMIDDDDEQMPPTPTPAARSQQYILPPFNHPTKGSESPDMHSFLQTAAQGDREFRDQSATQRAVQIQWEIERQQVEQQHANLQMLLRAANEASPLHAAGGDDADDDDDVEMADGEDEVDAEALE